MAASLAVILLLGLPARKIFEKLKLPGLIGMLVLGILIGPYGFNLLQEDMLKISGDLRGIALIIILLRAGFGIDKDDLKLLYVLLLYPEKFWKITNFYYNGKKSWVPQRNIQKLIGIQEQMEMKKQFLDCLATTLN